MRDYVVTFHTHFGAMKLYKALKSTGCCVRMAPVPRALSSDCGSCVKTAWDGSPEDLLSGDAEAVYLDMGREFRLLLSGE